MARETEPHRDLRIALVILSRALGDERLPDLPNFRFGDSIQSEREEHGPGDRLRRNASDRVQPGSRTWFLSARENRCVAAHLDRLLAPPHSPGPPQAFPRETTNPRPPRDQPGFRPRR